MSDTTNTLAAQLVSAVGRAAPCQHQGDDCDCTERNKNAAAAVLRTLHKQGYQTITKDGFGISKWTERLADVVESQS